MVHNLNIPKFKKMLEEHMDGYADYKSYIWRVYVLIKWMKNDKKNRYEEINGYNSSFVLACNLLQLH